MSFRAFVAFEVLWVVRRCGGVGALGEECSYPASVCIGLRHLTMTLLVFSEAD